jgi:outer membrane protein assembly factor BamB
VQPRTGSCENSVVTSGLYRIHALPTVQIMSIRILVRVSLALSMFLFCTHVCSAVTILWQTTLQSGTYPEQPVRVLLTPDGSKLLVTDDTHTSSAWVTELNPATGSTISPWPKSVSISGMDVCGTWIDDGGNIYLGSCWGGNHVYKYDPTLTTKIWEYSNPSPAFEYVRNIITIRRRRVRKFFQRGRYAGQVVEFRCLVVFSLQ